MGLQAKDKRRSLYTFQDSSSNSRISASPRTCCLSSMWPHSMKAPPVLVPSPSWTTSLSPLFQPLIGATSSCFKRGLGHWPIGPPRLTSSSRSRRESSSTGTHPKSASYLPGRPSTLRATFSTHGRKSDSLATGSHPMPPQLPTSEDVLP